MNNINGYCQYSTPCSWCTKWNKKCDKQIENNKNDICSDCINEGNLEFCKDCLSEIKCGRAPFRFQYYY